MSTFVSVGNAKQGFTRLLEMVRKAASDLPAPVFVQHGHTTWHNASGIQASAFIGMDEFAQRVQQAKVVILHAGAGSVIHAVRAGKVPVLLARRMALGEHVDDHQAEFAREVSAAGKAVLVNDNTTLIDAVRLAQKLQRDRGERPTAPPLVAMVADCLRRARISQP